MSTSVLKIRTPVSIVLPIICICLKYWHTLIYAACCYNRTDCNSDSVKQMRFDAFEDPRFSTIKLIKFWEELFDFVSYIFLIQFKVLRLNCLTCVYILILRWSPSVHLLPQRGPLATSIWKPASVSRSFPILVRTMPGKTTGRIELKCGSF